MVDWEHCIATVTVICNWHYHKLFVFQVPHVEAHFTFELDLQLSTTTGSCDTIDFTPGCETYFRFCLRASTNGQSRNIDDCPLGSHGRVNENNVPSTVSISSNSAWPVSVYFGGHHLGNKFAFFTCKSFFFPSPSRDPSSCISRH